MLHGDPCPKCGSRVLNWRRPGVIDKLRTWIAACLDFNLGGFGRGANSLPSLSLRGRGTAIEYTQLRENYEVNVGLTTPEWFWRCPFCGEKGSIFPEETVEEAEAASGVLGDIENQLGESGGGVNAPVSKTTKSD